VVAPRIIVARSEDTLISSPEVALALFTASRPLDHRGTHQAPERTTPISRAPQRRCPTVLLVDDELLIRESLGRFLERAGYTVIAVADPDTAARHLRKSDIHAVILDIRLAGGRSGLEVLERIRLDEASTDLPVIVLTGVYFLEPAEVALIHRHRADVFYKPEVGPRLVQHLGHLTGHAS